MVRMWRRPRGGEILPAAGGALARRPSAHHRGHCEREASRPRGGLQSGMGCSLGPGAPGRRPGAGSREPVALCRHLGCTPRSPNTPSPAPRAPSLGLSFPCGSWGARRRGLTGRGRGGARSGRARGRGCRPTAGFAGSGWARCRLGSGWAPAPRGARKRRCRPAPPAGGHVGSGRGPGRSRGGVAGRPRPAGPGGGRARGRGELCLPGPVPAGDRLP